MLEQAPNAAVVTDSAVRARIVASGFPWRVRDHGSGIEMLLVPSGNFLMGASPEDTDATAEENPVHEVTLSHAYYLGVTEVTQAQWLATMGNNPSYFKDEADSSTRPVERISWNDIQNFNTASGFRLPTEAEWEYACRGGILTSRYGVLTDIAWTNQNNNPEGTKAVRTKLPNDYGFYDMIGNVWEWNQDLYGDYSAESVTDPTGPSAGSSHVVRGCSWNDISEVCRASRRLGTDPDTQNEGGGFRVARTPLTTDFPDTDGDGVLDEIDNCISIANPNQADCNGDGIGDACELSGGSATDHNSNGIPDSCDITANSALDRNNNGILDSYEIAQNPTLDRNTNGELDSYEIAQNPALDRNTNGELDSYDIAQNPALDCNGNSQIDEYEIADNSKLDCNNNRVIDSCEIARGSESDCNHNGIPDGCDLLNHILSDDNHNGIPDSCELIGGAVTAWGRNYEAQCEIPTGALSEVLSIAGGWSHTVALKSNGSVMAWGYNYNGQCDIPNEASADVSAIASGWGHTLALKYNGSVLAWGFNGNTQCDIPSNAETEVSAIAGGGFHSMALKSDGSVLAWGRNYENQCDIPANAQSEVIAIGAGGYHSIALKSNGSVMAWGYNGDRECSVPESAGSNVTAIAGGAYHTVALKSNGTIVAWGFNYFGECMGTDALGAAITSSAQGQPVHILGVTLSKVIAIAAGGYHTAALKSDGSVVAWGNNDTDQCQVPKTTGFCTTISCGYYHTIALQIDCDGNGVADATQAIANPSLDLNQNYQLDSCEIITGMQEDCNHNWILDSYEQNLNAPVVLISAQLSPIGYKHSQTWTIATPANAVSDPVFEIKAFGDFSLTTEYLTVFMNNRFIGSFFKYPAIDCSEISQTMTIPMEIFNSIIAGSDGSTADLMIDCMPSIAVDAHACNNSSWIKASLSYTSAVGADCNANGLLDECEVHDYPETDFNSNGIVDECEYGGSVSSCLGDLDHNHVLDSGDVSLVLLNMGIVTMPGDPMDLDNNGVVDSGDVSLILLNNGPCK
ncbi:MAG: SUMF1/EgtB/PvdO family nonheme iron enzyme [Phycisphaerales bacterium]